MQVKNIERILLVALVVAVGVMAAVIHSLRCEVAALREKVPVAMNKAPAPALKATTPLGKDCRDVFLADLSNAEIPTCGRVGFQGLHIGGASSVRIKSFRVRSL